MGYTFHDRGSPQIDDDTCIGCGRCAAVCPDEVLAMDDGRLRAGDGIFMGCIACGHCVAVCPTAAIRVTGRGMQADDGIDLPAEAAAAPGPLEALLLRRRSIRRFADREADRAVLDRTLAATATAPMGIPPSEVGVVVVHGREKVGQFSARACETFARQARLFNPLVLTLMRPFIGKTAHAMFRDFVRPLLETLVEKRREGVDAFTYRAPALLLFHYRPVGDPADCHIAATVAMLAAESHGLGTCLLGTVTALNFDKRLKADYRIPAENKVGLGMVLGHPAVEYRRAVRRRLASVEYV